MAYAPQLALSEVTRESSLPASDLPVAVYTLDLNPVSLLLLEAGCRFSGASGVTLGYQPNQGNQSFMGFSKLLFFKHLPPTLVINLKGFYQS